MNNLMQSQLALPKVISPPTTICLTLDVPDDPDYLSALVGQLYQLTLWNAWDRDAGKNGKTVAALWKKAVSTLRTCDGKKIFPGVEQEDFMPLRVDCDCNVWITCCDGTEKQLLTADQVKALIAGGAVNGAPQPKPASCQDYQGQVQAGNDWLVPFPMSTGDTIEVTLADGATEQQTLGPWRCPDGTLYFSGACISGTETTDAGNPMPAVPTGKLIMNLDGTYYDLSGVVTVGAGVDHKQPALFFNYPLTASPSGTVAVTVRVCNNQLGSWSHTFNFRTSPGPFTPISGDGVWCAGSGWEGPPPSPDIPLRMRFTGAFDFHVVSEQALYSAQNIANGGIELILRNAALGIVADNTDTNAAHSSVSNALFSTTPNVAGVRVIDIDSDEFGASGGGVQLHQYTINGIGPDPF